NRKRRCSPHSKFGVRRASPLSIFSSLPCKRPATVAVRDKVACSSAGVLLGRTRPSLDRAGRSAWAYPPRRGRSLFSAPDPSAAPEQDQDFRHRARAVRGARDSGFAVQARAEVQAESDPEAVVLVDVRGIVPVAVGRAAVPGVVVPRAAAQDATFTVLP